jgi:hypothetical protein
VSNAREHLQFRLKHRYGSVRQCLAPQFLYGHARVLPRAQEDFAKAAAPQRLDARVEPNVGRERSVSDILSLLGGQA